MAYDEQIVTIKLGDATAEVHEDAVEVYEELGWTVVDDGSSESEAKKAPAKKTAASE